MPPTQRAAEPSVFITCDYNPNSKRYTDYTIYTKLTCRSARVKAIDEMPTVPTKPATKEEINKNVRLSIQRDIELNQEILEVMKQLDELPVESVIARRDAEKDIKKLQDQLKVNKIMRKCLYAKDIYN